MRHLMSEARRRGYCWIGLETGRTGPFRPAVQLYRKYGFRECKAYGEYVADEFSQCMSLDLAD